MSNGPGKGNRHLRWRLEALRAAGVEWVERNQVKRRQTQRQSPSVHPELSPCGLFELPLDAGPRLTPEEKRRALQLLEETEVRHCTRCPVLVRNRTQTVFGVGDPNAELCFVGEAPGAEEDAQGEPFVGAAGQLLNRILAACKLRREDVYICNVLKCRPPGNRTPLPDEVANCSPFLHRQLEIIRPRFICALGACASQALLNTTASIGRLRGRFHDYRGIKLLCTYHPAYLLRNPAAKREVWEDMKMLMRAMGRPVD